MNHLKSKTILVFFISIFGISSAQADQTLPHRSKFSQGQEITPAVTRYNRIPASASRQDNQDKSTANANSQQQLAKQQEIEKAKAEKQRQMQALAANNKAVQLGKEGRFDEAIAAHEEAVQLDPENKQFRINLSAAYCAYGQKLLTQNNFPAAVLFSRKALVAASDNALASKTLTESLKKMGINPNSADERLNLADALMSQGDIGGAGIEYQIAEQLEQSARTFVKMGDYAYRLGQIDLAANWYSQATAKDLDYAPAYRQLGYIALAKQDQSQAASLLRKAVILDNKDKAAGITLVDLWRKQVSSNPQIAENHLGLASSLQLTGDLSGAELEYKKVAALDPHNPALPSAEASLQKAYQHAEAERHAAAAETLWGQNLKQDALTEIAQAVRMEPKNAQYQFSLAECLEATGDLQGAHQAYLTCVLIDPENNKEAAARLRALRESSVNANPSANAAEQNSVNQNTNNTAAAQAASAPSTSSSEKSAANVIPDQVQSLEAAHDYNQAITMLKELASNNLENPEIHHRLAVDLMSNGDIGEAISEFRIASALAPEQKSYAADLAQALNINKQALDKSNESKLDTVNGTK